MHSNTPGLIAALLVSVGLSACGGSGDTATTQTKPPASAGAPATAPVESNDVVVKSTEYAFAPSAITAKAGKVKLTLDNAGSIPHELVILKTDQKADALKVTDGRVGEADSVGELAETDARGTKTKSFDLKPGTYVYVCNISGHYGFGMKGTLTVK